MDYTGFWKRFLAYLLDTIPIVFGVAAVFYFFFGFDEAMQSYQNARYDMEARIRFLEQRNLIRNISFVLYIFYCMALEGSPLQGTIGKLMCGIKVVDEDGDPITFVRSIARNAMKIVSYAVCSVGFIWAAFSGRKQGWHDLVAGTFVIYR